MVILLTVATLLHISIFLLCLRRPSSEIPVHWSTWVICAGGLILWLASNQPLFAAVEVVVADGIAAWPTVQNAWNNPYGEPHAIWLAEGCALLIGVLAVETASPAALIYPVYLAVGSLTIGCIALLRRRES